MRSLTCHYLRRPAAGPMELHVEPIRSGRRFTTARVTATQDGKEMIAALAALATPGLPEPMTWLPDPPDLGPPPEADADWAEFDERMPALLRQLRIAPRVGGPPFSGQPLIPGTPPEAGGWIQLAEPRGIDAAFVALCTDVWWPPSLQPLTTAAGAPTIDLTIHFRADLPREPLPDQPVLGHFRTTAATEGLIEEDGVVFAADGTLLAQSRQLALFTPIG
jgi:acyl-CoA thioesterase